MKINFSTINKIFAPKMAMRKDFTTLLQTLPNDIVELKSPVLDTPNGIITKLKGTFSKEELTRIDALVEIFKRTGFDIAEIKQSIARLLQISLQKCSFDKFEDTNKLLFDPQKITPEFKKTVNNSMVQLLAIKKIQNNNNLYATPAPLSSWYNTTLGIMNPTFTPSRFTHPRDKAIQLTGELTFEDFDKIKKQEPKFKQLNDDKIFNKKLKILHKLNQAFSKNETDFIGTFSDRELSKFKKLVIEYDALNNIQISRGIFTKKIESKLFATQIPDNLESSDYINGLGLVVNKISIKDKSAIIVLSSNEEGFSQFRMYDLAALKNADSESEENKSLISEIRFKHIQDHYLIRSFQNHYPKDYPDAGKIIGLQLMKLLAEKDCKPLEIEALAYAGSKHSPVNYYMHYGFTPVNYTKEEIEELAKQNGGNFPYETPVKLVLNDFEGVRERIKRMEKIYFS